MTLKKACKPPLLLMVLLVTATPFGLAAEEPAEISESKRLITGSLNVGLNQTFLDLETQRSCTNCVEDAVDYDTEGVNLYRIYGNVNVWGGSVFEFKYEQPFKRTSDQETLLAARKVDETSYEKFAAGFILDPLAERLFSEESLSHKIYKRLLSLKYVFNREVFLGRVKPNSNSVFLPLNTTINYTNSTIVNGTPVTPGDQLTFKTAYTDRELSMAMLKVKLHPIYIAETAIRLGYYDATWERLSDVQLSQFSAGSLIYEAKFKSKGILVSLQTTDMSAPGLNVDTWMKLGTDDSVQSPLDWRQISNSDVDVQAAMVKFGGWYNHYFNKKTRDGWSLSAGGSMELRSVKVKTDSTLLGEAVPENENRDALFQYFVSAGYRF